MKRLFFYISMVIQRSQNLFSRELLKKFLISAPFSARKFLRDLRSKTEKFSLHFFNFAPPIFLKKEKKIFKVLKFREFGTAEAELQHDSMFASPKLVYTCLNYCTSFLILLNSTKFIHFTRMLSGKARTILSAFSF